MNKIEKILFQRIEVWLVLLTIPLFIILLLIFGAMVRNVAHEGSAFGIIGEIAYKLASVPSKLNQIITYEDPHSISAKMKLNRDKKAANDSHLRFADRSGFSYTYETNTGIIEDYLLLSRYDGDKGYSVVELYDLDRQQHIYTWPMDDSKFRTQKFDNQFITYPNEENVTLIAKHPQIAGDGSLVFHAESSPLYSISTCGAINWFNAEFAYHHSLERDGDGNYWVPGLRQTILDTFDEEYKDDHIVKISSTGKVLYSKSVTEILQENDLINRMYVYDKYVTDTIHLNDIEPVSEDAEHWNKGDVLLSIGHLNMIMLYRPSTGRVIWWSQDRIMHQHDIDIIGDGKISVYNNNRTTRAEGDLVIGLNELLVWDISSNRFAPHYQEAFEKFEIKTINQGLHDFSTDGNVMVDETNYGRVLMFDETGHLHWEFINRADNGKVFSTRWPRLIPKQLGMAAEKAIASHACN